jgi:hypothetical protein
MQNVRTVSLTEISEFLIQKPSLIKTGNNGIVMLRQCHLFYAIFRGSNSNSKFLALLPSDSYVSYLSVSDRFQLNLAPEVLCRQTKNWAIKFHFVTIRYNP